jgi:hypothetical protein
LLPEGEGDDVAVGGAQEAAEDGIDGVEGDIGDANGKGFGSGGRGRRKSTRAAEAFFSTMAHLTPLSSSNK